MFKKINIKFISSVYLPNFLTSLILVFMGMVFGGLGAGILGTSSVIDAVRIRCSLFTKVPIEWRLMPEVMEPFELFEYCVELL